MPPSDDNAAQAAAGRADPPDIAPSARELDDLDLLLWGVFAPLTGFGGRRSGVTLTVPPSLAERAREAGSARLVDPQGAPLATMLVERTGPDGDESVALVGPVQRLAERTGRLFGRLYEPPSTMDAETVTAIAETPPSAIDLERIATAAAGRPVRLLALAGHGRPVGTSAAGLIRACLAAATHLPDASVIAVPLARHGDPEVDEDLRRRTIAAYSSGAPPIELAGTGPVPDDIASAALAGHRTGQHRGVVVLFTGLSGSGKSTLAAALRDALEESGTRAVSLLDGDVVRRELSAGLGFSRQDRERNVSRIGFVAAEIARHGGVAICSPIAPFADTRDAVRRMVAEAGGEFVLVHVATPLAECERRDRKGLYARARRGEIADFTGISSPYEEPADADLTLDTTGREIPVLVRSILNELADRGLIPHGTPVSRWS